MIEPWGWNRSVPPPPPFWLVISRSPAVGSLRRSAEGRRLFRPLLHGSGTAGSSCAELPVGYAAAFGSVHSRQEGPSSLALSLLLLLVSPSLRIYEVRSFNQRVKWSRWATESTDDEQTSNGKRLMRSDSVAHASSLHGPSLVTQKHHALT